MPGPVRLTSYADEPPRRRRLPSLALAFGLGCLGGLAGPAYAQPEPPADVLIVASSPESPHEALEQTATELLLSLPAAGHPLRRPHVAEVGRGPAALDPDLRARIERAAEELIEDVAFGRTSTVVSRVEPLVREASRDLDALGGEPSTARRLVDLLLFQARVLLESDPAASRDAVRRALTYAPDAQPDPSLHPAPVMEQVRAALAERRTSGPVLAIDVDGATQPCEVRVNGWLAGAPPIRLRVLRGRYQVRVSCGMGPGRVHEVAPGGSGVRLNPRLDAVLTQHGPLDALSYPLEPASTVIRDDAAQLASRLAPSGVLLLRDEDGVTRLERIEAGRSEPTSQVSSDAADPAARAAELARGVGAASATRIGRAELSPASGPADEGLTITAWTLFGLGVLSAAAAWWTVLEYIQRAEWARIAEPIDPDFDARQLRRDEFELVPWTLGALSSGILAAALALGVASEPEPAWWTWALGAIGAGLVAGGIAALVDHQGCADETCDRVVLQAPLAGVLLMQGATLALTPLFALLRSATGMNDIAPFAMISPAGQRTVALAGLSGRL